MMTTTVIDRPTKESFSDFWDAPRLVNPMFLNAPIARQAAPGKELVDLRELGIFNKIVGAETGYHTQADALVTQTSDNVDLNALWAEFQQTLEIFNDRRNALVSLLSYPVTALIERVPQVGSVEFEDASEFGVPKGVRLVQSFLSLGYDFRDYDIATRFTWKYLRDHDARAVQAVHNAILEADNRLLFRRVMEAIFDNSGRNAEIGGDNVPVYPLYNNDGTVPPSYKGKTFLSTHTHYIASQHTGDPLIDPQDLEDAYDKISEHGYGAETGSTFVMLANRIEVKDIRKFKAGVATNGIVANYDFIPSANSPTMIVPNATGLIGNIPPSTWNGLQVVGSYMGILIIEEDYIPAGYFLMFATGGTQNLGNLVGIREHANPAYRGLRLLPGNQQGYPLVESFYSRSFGTGVRQRGGAVVVQITELGEPGADAYVAPAQYKRGGGNG